MIKKADSIYDAALQLPTEERVALVARLIESFDGQADTGVDAAWADEIQQRIKDAEQGKATFIPWEQARQMIVGEYDGTREH